MKIEKLEEADIQLIRPLWERLNQLHGDLSPNFKAHFRAFTFEDRVGEFEDRDGLAVFVARDGSRISGYCIASFLGDTGEIDSIYIDPDTRETGLGSRLIDTAEAWLNKKKLKRIRISVSSGNESVFGFYQKHGYQSRFTMLEKKAP